MATPTRTCLLFTLSHELFLLVTDRLGLGDLYALSVTCRSMTALVGPLLYKRAVNDGIAEKKFYHAAINGSANAVLRFLEAGAVSLAAFKEYKGTMLWWHSHCRSTTKMKLFSRRVHPLLAAAGLGHVDVVKALLSLPQDEEERGVSIDFADEEGRTALSYAVEECEFDMLNFLMAQGAMIARDPSSLQRNSPLFVAVSCRNKEALKMMIAKLRGRRVPEWKVKRYCKLLAYKACANGFDDIVEYSLRQGLDVNTPIMRNRRLLYYASSFGKLSTVKLLVEYGARLKNERDTGVLAATINGHLQIVEFLLDSGCSVADGGLHACAMWWYAENLTYDKWERESIYGILREKGFRKEACRHDCWSKQAKFWSFYPSYDQRELKEYVANVILRTCNSKKK